MASLHAGDCGVGTFDSWLHVQLQQYVSYDLAYEARLIWIDATIKRFNQLLKENKK